MKKFNIDAILERTKKLLEESNKKPMDPIQELMLHVTGTIILDTVETMGDDAYEKDLFEKSNFVIVKVQLPIATNEKIPLALVYDKTRTIELQVPVTEIIKAKMQGTKKRYFYMDKNQQIQDEAPTQEW